MIGGLFFINCFLCIITFLTTAMVHNHFKKINKSIEIYNDPKIYKQQSEIAFLNKVIYKYQEFKERQVSGRRDELEISLETMVENAFYEEKVGKFSYHMVQALALKTKGLMWGILAIQIFIEIFSKEPGASELNFKFVMATTVLCVTVTFLSIIKSIPEYRDQLFIKIQDYIIHTYPIEIENKNKQNEINRLMEKIQKLEHELEDETQDINEEGLNEKDIMNFLNELDLPLK